MYSAVSFLGSAAMKKIYALLVEQTWCEERQILLMSTLS
jgi:hypothetical protein